MTTGSLQGCSDSEQQSQSCHTPTLFAVSTSSPNVGAGGACGACLGANTQTSLNTLLSQPSAHLDGVTTEPGLDSAISLRALVLGTLVVGEHRPCSQLVSKPDMANLMCTTTWNLQNTAQSFSTPIQSLHMNRARRTGTIVLGVLGSAASSTSSHFVLGTLLDLVSQTALQKLYKAHRLQHSSLYAVSCCC